MIYRRRLEFLKRLAVCGELDDDDEEIHTVEEDTTNFSGALSNPPGTLGFKIELPSTDGLALDDMPRIVFLDGVSHTKLDITSACVHGVNT